MTELVFNQIVVLLKPDHLLFKILWVFPDQQENNGKNFSDRTLQNSQNGELESRN